MEYQLYNKYLPQISLIEQRAADLHASVNQYYDSNLPYSFHLRLTASYLTRYSHLIDMNEDNVQTLYAAMYFHDSLEDARLTYNDLKKVFCELNQQDCNINVVDAAELVYALTNDKGRTRLERAGDNYYRGIRETPFAPVLKMCDRLANVRYSTLFVIHQRMIDVYRKESQHFIQSINEGAVTPFPQEMAEELNILLDI